MARKNNGRPKQRKLDKSLAKTNVKAAVRDAAGDAENKTVDEGLGFWDSESDDEGRVKSEKVGSKKGGNSAKSTAASTKPSD